MSIGNPNFGRFERNDEEINKSEKEEVADPNADTEDNILERIDREKEEEKAAQEERKETPPAMVGKDDVEDLSDTPIRDEEEEKDFSRFEDGSLPPREGSRKSAEAKDPDARLRRKPEERFHRTKKIREDKAFKKKEAA